MVYILLCDGFEEMEAVIPYDVLHRADIPACYVGVSDTKITGAHGTVILAERMLNEIDFTDGEMILLPGGGQGVENLLSSQNALTAVKTVWEKGGFVAAICAAPAVLATLGITDGKRVTCYPDAYWKAYLEKATLITDSETVVAAVRDDRVITGTSAGCALPFAFKLVEALRGQEKVEAVRRELVIG